MTKCSFCSNDSEFSLTIVEGGRLREIYFCKSHAASYSHSKSAEEINEQRVGEVMTDVVWEMFESEKNDDINCFEKAVASRDDKLHNDMRDLSKILRGEEKSVRIPKDVDTNDVVSLRKLMKKYTIEENYLKAAEVRDKIKSIDDDLQK